MISVVTPTIRPEGLVVVRDSLLKQTHREFEWLVDINTTGQVDLNQSLNRLLKRAKGELVVFLQDHIQIEEDGLEQFWRAYKDKPAFYTAPVGKVKQWGDEPKWDWRIHREDIEWTEWEIDWGCAPRGSLFKIGGFDEKLDRYWGFDNVNIGLRAHIAGYPMGCIKDNRAVAFDHDAHEKHPFRKKQNSKFHNQRLDDIRYGNFESFI